MAPPTLDIEAPPTFVAPPTLVKPLGPLLAAAVHDDEELGAPKELPTVIIMPGVVVAMGTEMVAGEGATAGELLVRGDGLVDSVRENLDTHDD